MYACQSQTLQKSSYTMNLQGWANVHLQMLRTWDTVYSCIICIIYCIVYLHYNCKPNFAYPPAPIQKNKENGCKILMIGVFAWRACGCSFYTLCNLLCIGNLLAFTSFRKKHVSSKKVTMTNAWDRIIIAIEFLSWKKPPKMLSLENTFFMFVSPERWTVTGK